MKDLQVNNFPELSFDVTEALNQLRVNLGFCGDDIKKVMITSSVPNEGKSFIAMELWKMMAEVGVPTLIIDCDLRNSEMKTKYGLTFNEKMLGIVHYLAGKADMDDVIYKTNIINGYVMPVGSSVVNPTMLLEGKRFGDIIKKVGEVFSFIIIDTPPLGSVADALNVAKYCDGSILVVRSGETPRKLVKNSVDLLGRTSTPLLGTVLNRVDTSGSTNGYYYKRYYRKNYYYYNNYSNNNGGHTKGSTREGK